LGLVCSLSLPPFLTMEESRMTYKLFIYHGEHKIDMH
jgi:hypothetical protein